MAVGDVLKQIGETVRNFKRAPRTRSRTLTIATERNPDLWVVKTPEAGIAKATGSVDLIPGSASCEIHEWTGGTYDPTGDDVTVHNLSTDAVAGDTFISCYQENSGSYLITPAASPTEAVQIKVRNDTGAIVPIYRALALNGPVTVASSNLSGWQAAPPVFKGTTPATGTPGDWGRFVITQEELAIGGTGNAIVSGITPLQVYKPSTVENWDRIDIRNSSTLGQENWHGCCEILDVENVGQSDRWAWVRLSNYESPLIRGTADSTITAGSSGDVTVKGPGSDEGTVTVYNAWMEAGHDIGGGDELYFVFERKQNRYQIVSAEC